MTFFVVCTEDGRYVDLDDHPGPMSSGYPYLTDDIFMARRSRTSANAFELLKSAKATLQYDNMHVMEMDFKCIRILDEKNAKTAYQWLSMFDLFVLDPDGWRQNDGVTMDTPITLIDFSQRFHMSTVRNDPKNMDRLAWAVHAEREDEK